MIDAALADCGFRDKDSLLFVPAAAKLALAKLAIFGKAALCLPDRNAGVLNSDFFDLVGDSRKPIRA